MAIILIFMLLINDLMAVSRSPFWRKNKTELKNDEINSMCFVR
jgi:hypothetical protein